MHHQRLDPGKVEDVPLDHDAARVGHRRAGRIRPGRHPVARDPQHVAASVVRPAVKDQPHGAVGHLDGRRRTGLVCPFRAPGEDQIVSVFAVERHDVAGRHAHFVLDVERVVPVAGIHRDVKIVHAFAGVGHLDHVVATAQRHLDVFGAARVDIDRLLHGIVFALDRNAHGHGGVGRALRVLAENLLEQIQPRLRWRGRIGGRVRREQLREGLFDKRQVRVRGRRRIQEVDHIVAALAVDHHRDALDQVLEVVRRGRNQVDGKAVQGESAALRGADVDRIGAEAAVDGERSPVTAQHILLAVSSVQVDRIRALPGVDHGRLHLPVRHGRHAGPLDRRCIHRPSNGRVAQRHVSGLGDGITDDVGLIGRVGLVLEEDGSQPRAVDGQRALDRIQRSRVLVPRHGADVYGVVAVIL